VYSRYALESMELGDSTVSVFTHMNFRRYLVEFMSPNSGVYDYSYTPILVLKVSDPYG